ncbi:MAG: class D beta-lactamase [Pyrinomonadaceae bacterium]
MKNINLKILFVVCLLFFANTFAACSKEKVGAVAIENKNLLAETEKSVEKDDLKKFFDEYKVTGCFVLYDRKENKFVRYNSKRCAERFTPASTFKIPNSLIALETGVIKDENEIIKWDGVKRDRAEWNKDHTLDSAFEFSALWFYQEIARRVGEERMRKYVNDFAYGNRNISGGIDQFWLRGNLRISPDEQITFLREVYENKLPVSARSIEILKKIMLTESNPNYKLFAKTGAGRNGKKRLGWYTGFVEQNGNVYYFANNIEAENTNENFMPARIEIAKKILNELGLLGGK